jgi:hypothetical protein
MLEHSRKLESCSVLMAYQLAYSDTTAISGYGQSATWATNGFLQIQ